MSNAKPHVVVTRKLPGPVEDRMGEMFQVRLNGDDHPFTKEELIAAVADADVLAPTVTDGVDADVIAAAGERLKLIANFGVGVNHIDVTAAKAMGIAVSNTPGVLTEDTADLTMALILMAPRRLGEGERAVRAGAWAGWAPTQLMGRRVSAKKLGIVGMGRIGTAVAARARGFDMEIHYHNRKPVAAEVAKRLGATFWEDLDAMLAAMDIVSLNCPQTPETEHLMSAERLAGMQPHAYLVNTSRGGVIDEAALAEALARGAIAGAGLDVYEGEPAVHPKLMDLENVVLLPHLGSATQEGRVAMGNKVIDNIEAFAAGRPLADPVE